MAALGTRLLKLSLGGSDVTAQLSVAKITSGESESDFVSFADAAAGGARDYKLVGTAVQDMATGTVWDRIWSAAGTTVAGVLMPYGNATPTTTQPHYSFNAVITEPDGDLIGGEADSSTTAKMLVEFEWALTAKPTKVTA